MQHEQLPDRCPLCFGTDSMVYVRMANADPRTGWYFLCSTCCGWQDTYSFYCVQRANTRFDAVLRHSEWRPSRAPEEPHAQHSAIGEPMTVDDFLYEALGYYPAVKE